MRIYCSILCFAVKYVENFTGNIFSTVELGRWWCCIGVDGEGYLAVTGPTEEVGINTFFQRVILYASVLVVLNRIGRIVFAVSRSHCVWRRIASLRQSKLYLHSAVGVCRTVSIVYIDSICFREGNLVFVLGKDMRLLSNFIANVGGCV